MREGEDRRGSDLTRRGVSSAALILLSAPLVGGADSAPGHVLEVGLFTGLATVHPAPSTKTLRTTGHSRPGLGAARYVEDPDQGLRPETPYRKKTGDGRWFVLGEPEIDVLMTGAIGDGQTDDTLALQAAMDAGRRIFVSPPASYYRITSPIALRSGQVVRGVGATSRVRQFGAEANAGVLWGDHVSDVAVAGLALTPGPAAEGMLQGHAVHFRDSRNVIVDGIHIDGHSRGGVTLQNCADVGVTSCRIRNAARGSRGGDHRGSGYDILVVNGGRSIAITGNHCRNGAGIGIAVQPQAAGGPFQFDDIEIKGNVIDGEEGYGILLYRSGADTFSRMQVDENVIANISGALRQAEYGRVFGAGIYVQGVDGAVISRNRVRATNLDTEVEMLAPAGIGVANTSDVQILDNVVEDCRWYGIAVFDPNHEGPPGGTCRIEGNTIRSSARSGIYAKSVPGALIRNNTVSASGEHGLLVQTAGRGPGRFEIAGNHFNANRGQGVFFLDGEAEVIDNEVKNNGGGGIVLANGRFSLERNVVVDNSAFGVSAARGVEVALSSNHIQGNRAGQTRIEGRPRGS